MAEDDLHYDLHRGVDFDPRETSYVVHVGYCDDWEGEVGVVSREIVVGRMVGRMVARYHSLDKLDEVPNQFGPRSCAGTEDIAAP